MKGPVRDSCLPPNYEWMRDPCGIGDTEEETGRGGAFANGSEKELRKRRNACFRVMYEVLTGALAFLGGYGKQIQGKLGASVTGVFLARLVTVCHTPMWRHVASQHVRPRCLGPLVRLIAGSKTLCVPRAEMGQEQGGLKRRRRMGLPDAEPCEPTSRASRKKIYLWLFRNNS